MWRSIWVGDVGASSSAGVESGIIGWVKKGALAGVTTSDVAKEAEKDKKLAGGLSPITLSISAEGSFSNLGSLEDAGESLSRGLGSSEDAGAVKDKQLAGGLGSSEEAGESPGGGGLTDGGAGVSIGGMGSPVEAGVLPMKLSISTRGLSGGLGESEEAGNSQRLPVCVFRVIGRFLVAHRETE